jgi:hypothetical protein
MGNILGKITGGLLGGPKPQPQQVLIRGPKIDEEQAKQAGAVDPNRADAVADARKRRRSLSGRIGRSALKINLTAPGTQTRGGISIR